MQSSTKKNLIPIVTTLLVTTVITFVLSSQGRSWWSKSGQVKLWIGDAWSGETSQQFMDPYSFSHLQHGLLFFGFLYWLTPKLSVLWRFCIATIIEAAWEVLENSAIIIDRYREGTAALGYEGDTIFNSVGDLVSCGLGFIVAYYLGFWRTLILFIIIEVAMVFTIYDSLLLNVIMLVYPIGK
jgi:hypothetical protein